MPILPFRTSSPRKKRRCMHKIALCIGLLPFERTLPLLTSNNWLQNFKSEGAKSDFLQQTSAACSRPKSILFPVLLEIRLYIRSNICFKLSIPILPLWKRALALDIQLTPLRLRVLTAIDYCKRTLKIGVDGLFYLKARTWEAKKL